MSGCEFRFSLIGKLKKKIQFWKSAHGAMQINTIMDSFQSNHVTETKTYQKIKCYAKAAVATFIAFLIFLVVGCISFVGSVSNKAVSDAQTMVYDNGVTYGELIDVYLWDAEWTVFNSESDMAVVEVNGISVEGEDICIQFWGDSGMGLSYRSLTLAFFEADGVAYEPDAFMEYIYWNYYLNN